MESMLESRLSSPFRRRVTTALASGFVLFLVYSPVFRFDYLYHDDWVHFSTGAAPCRESPMYGWSQITGRLGEQYVVCGMFRLFGTVDQAWRARAAVVAGIAAFAFLQEVYLEALGLSWVAALSLALGTATLPGMLVFGFWLTGGSIVPSLLATVGAALLTERAVQTRGHAFLLVAAACALQIISLSIYQTGAMYIWTLTAVMLAARLSMGFRAMLRPLWLYAFVGAAPAIGYFVWFRYLSGWGPVFDAQDPIRGAMFSSLGESVEWFLGTALPLASSLWLLDASRAAGFVILALFVAALIVAAVRTGGAGGAAYACLVASLAMVVYLPMIVTNYRYPFYRSLVPLSALLVLTGAIHLGMLLRADRWPVIATACCGSGLVLAASCLAWATLLHRMVVPAAAEYAFVRDSIGGASRVHVIVPVRTRRMTTDEVDSFTIQFRQDVEPMIRAVSRERGSPVVTVTSSVQGVEFNARGAVVLDFPELAKRGLWRSVRPAGP